LALVGEDAEGTDGGSAARYETEDKRKKKNTGTMRVFYVLGRKVPPCLSGFATLSRE